MNSKIIKWGVLSTAKIGIEKVIPAMQKCDNLEIHAISSRNEQNARLASEKLGIQKSYGDYESMLKDPEIDAIYSPLPNHLHYAWTKMAIEHGKHVLCEKPMTLDKDQVAELIALRDQMGVKAGEAFMVHTHPQWLDAVQRIKNGELGQLNSVQGFFSYHKTDPANIRNILEYGGGAMWDIGCYPVHTSRYAFGQEPTRVVSLIDRDPDLKIDRQASVLMDFPSGQCIFTVSTQLVPYQKMIFFGEKKKLEIEIPFNAPHDRTTNIFIDEGGLPPGNPQQITFEACDQYAIQAERFSQAIIDDTDVPVSLENAYGNTAVIEAIFQSAEKGRWINI